MLNKMEMMKMLNATADAYSDLFYRAHKVLTMALSRNAWGQSEKAIRLMDYFRGQMDAVINLKKAL